MVEFDNSETNEGHITKQLTTYTSPIINKATSTYV